MVVLMNNKQRKGRKILFIAMSVLLLSVVGMFGFNDNNDAYAKKPQAVIDWSNGFPSGEHANLNIHGKKLDPFFNCDNSVEAEPFGKSIFVPLDGTSKIEFVSNKRASGFDILKVLDPCAAPFGQNPTDAALIQLEAEEMQVYWRILGKPNNGSNSPSTAMLAFPTLIEACNFLPIEFADGSIVNSFDPDAVANAGAGLGLIAFNPNEMYAESGDFAGFDAKDSIYRDIGGDPGFVDAGDTLLYDGGAVVAIGTALVPFAGNEKHEDSTMNGMFDPGETVYRDVDGDGTVSATSGFEDIRLANASSQGLPESEGGNEIDCSKDTLVGLGLINNKGVFLKDGETLKRFEDPEPVKGKGKGKSKAVEITDLFKWSGVLCDPSLDTNVGSDGVPDGELTLVDDFPLLTEAIIDAAITTARGDLLWPTTPHSDSFDTVISQEEFTAYLSTLVECEEFTEQWIFIIADIIRYGLDYVNDGTTLTQMRFYPVATTEFS